MSIVVTLAPVERPSVDVIVPFRGTVAERESLRAVLTSLRLRPDDSLVVADNTPGATTLGGPVPVVAAAEVSTPGYARNRGAALGDSPWLVFIDADTVPVADLVDRYFDPPPGTRTALLAGGVIDEPVPPEAPPAARYAHLRGLMGQENTFRLGEWSFPQTANAGCRREAFEAAEGFREDIRAGEDADLTYRLKAAGWEIERREAAWVTHRSRQTVRGLVRQLLGHGAGGAWLAAQYPGFPARERAHLLSWAMRRFVRGAAGAVWQRSRDRALWAIFEPLEDLAYKFGGFLPNHSKRFPAAVSVESLRVTTAQDDPPSTRDAEHPSSTPSQGPACRVRRASHKRRA